MSAQRSCAFIHFASPFRTNEQHLLQRGCSDPDGFCPAISWAFFGAGAASFVARRLSHEAIIVTFAGLIVVISVWEGQLLEFLVIVTIALLGGLLSRRSGFNTGGSVYGVLRGSTEGSGIDQIDHLRRAGLASGCARGASETKAQCLRLALICEATSALSA